MADGGEAIRRLEGLAAATWPAAEIETLGGWRLGFTDGVTRRANSVLPNDWSDTVALGDAIDQVEQRYRARALPPVFKLTDASVPSALAQALADRGYKSEGESDTLVRSLGRDEVPSGAGTVRTFDEPEPAWTEVSLAGRDQNSVRTLTALAQRLPKPRTFALVELDGAPVSAGFAASTDGRVSIAGVHTLPAARRRGAARRLMSTLALWAAEVGASMLFLQVERDNPAAQALYRNLGYTRAYGYRYLVARD